MHKIPLIFACLLLFSCSPKKEVKIPDNVLSKQKMAEVMLDVNLMEAALNANTFNADKVTASNPVAVFNSLEKYKLSEKQYYESLDFYTKHPILLNELYQLVLNDLSKMQAEVNNKK